MFSDTFKQLLGALGLFLAQWLVLGRLSLWGATPDVVLLYVAWIGLTRGRLPAMGAGFALGFLMDVVYQTWGIHMLVKTLIGFLMGLIPPTEREAFNVTPTQALVGGTVIALVHNGLLVVLLALQAGVSSTTMVTVVWLGAAVYTGAVGTLAALLRPR
ncbi:MAG: rod shape-determining protein MreD [Bacteroidota bacterium]